MEWDITFVGLERFLQKLSTVLENTAYFIRAHNNIFIGSNKCRRGKSHRQEQIIMKMVETEIEIGNLDRFPHILV